MSLASYLAAPPRGSDLRSGQVAGVTSLCQGDGNALTRLHPALRPRTCENRAIAGRRVPSPSRSPTRRVLYWIATWNGGTSPSTFWSRSTTSARFFGPPALRVSQQRPDGSTTPGHGAPARKTEIDPNARGLPGRTA